MRYFILIFSSLLVANTNNSSKLCKTCHPIIYNEYKSSMHFKSTLQKDAVHKALWNKNPLSKENNYQCAKCHNPEVKNKLDNGVDCVSCHTIKNIKEHMVSNINIYENKDKTFYSKDLKRADKKIVYHKTSSFFGMFSSTVGSPYHDIDYRNKIYYNGKMCMGCHSHLKNSNNINLCSLPNKGASNTKENCITCHMPKIKGSATTIKLTKSHAYHGFLGAYNKPLMLSKYIDLSINKTSTGFNINIKNNTPHPLFTQPLRVVRLKIDILDNNKNIFSKNIDFKKVLGKNGQESIPATADSILEDSMLKENETRVIKIDFNNLKNKKVIATLGYFRVDPKKIKTLGLKDSSLSDFIELKKLEYQF